MREIQIYNPETIDLLETVLNYLYELVILSRPKYEIPNHERFEKEYNNLYDTCTKFENFVEKVKTVYRSSQQSEEERNEDSNK